MQLIGLFPSEIAKKKLKNIFPVTSAFVEFGLPEFAEACVRETRDIHGQKVELRISDRPGILNTKG